MVSLRADETCLLKDLGLFIEPVEVCDAEGKMIGLFVPANLERCRQMYAEAATNLDLAVVERLKQDPRPGEPLERTLFLLKKLQHEVERRGVAGEKAMNNEEILAFYRHLRDQPQTQNGPSIVPHAAKEADACVSP